MICETCKEKVDISDFSYPFVIKKCPDCGREMKLREPGKDGIGFHVKKGDRIIIPEEWIKKISPNPLQSNAHFSKEGLRWFAHEKLVVQLPNKKDEIEEELRRIADYCEDILNDSKSSQDLDLKNPEHIDALFQSLSQQKYSVDWWALLVAIFIQTVFDAIEENEIKKAVWAMGCAERYRCLIVFAKYFEDVVWMGHSARRILDVINLWDSNKENSEEEFWQQTFNENPYMLSQIFSAPVVFIEDKAYVGGMNIDKHDAKFVDYLFKSESSNEALLIEIKTPVTKLLGGKYRGIFKPSAELSGSIVQVLDYRRDLSRNLRHITEGKHYDIDAFNPRCVVIAGNSETELKDDICKKSFELFRSSFKDVEVITFDELFRKAETLANLFNLTRKPQE